MQDDVTPMLRSEALVNTANAARYMGQLCKHFGHKIPTKLSDSEGSISFPMGRCALSAAEQVLTMRAEAADAEALARVEEVVASHLDRFAFRDKPAVRWVRIVDMGNA